MKPWQFAVVGLALLTNSGCRVDPAIPILERQLRLQEDEIYRLRGRLEDLQDCSDSCSQRTVSSRRDDADSRGAADRGSRARAKGSASEPASVAPPKVEFSSPGDTEVPSTLKTRDGAPPPGVPEVPKHLREPATLPGIDKNGTHPGPDTEPGKASDATPADGPALGAPPSARGASRGQHGRLAPSNGRIPTLAVAGDSRQVASIALDRTLTGGVNDGGRAGDKGVLVIVEPRDPEGRVVDAPADISVAVLDPAVLDDEGKAVRVARWDFTAAETAKMFRRTGAGPAVHIETLWPEGPPIHNNLHVFVRYTTADGRQLEANQPIEVALAGEKSARQSRPQEARSNRPPSRGAARPTATLSHRPTWSPER